MRTIMFNSEKGGTGKTTLACLLASYRAVTGERVLLVDADAQADVADVFGVPEAPDLYDCIVRGVSINERAVQPPPESWMPSSVPATGSLHILAGNKESALIPQATNEALALRWALEQIEGIDTVIIDSGPSSGMLLSLVWAASDYVIVPTQTESLSVKGMVETISSAMRAGVQIAGIVPTFYDERQVLHRYYYGELRAAASENRWNLFEPIARRVEWAESTHLRTQIFSIDERMSKARLEAIQFCQQVGKVIAHVA